jgi:uncharacterized membrane protein
MGEVRTMMWWGPGWWWVGGVFMIVCIVMMVRMMGHGHPMTGHSHPAHDERYRPDRENLSDAESPPAETGSTPRSSDSSKSSTASEILAERFARGEISEAEFEQKRSALERRAS